MSEAYEILEKRQFDAQDCTQDYEEIPILGLIELAFHQLIYVKRLLPKNCFRKVMWRGVVTYMCILEEVKKEIMSFLENVGGVIIKNPQSQVHVIFSVERVISDEVQIVLEEYIFLVNGPGPPCLRHSELVEMVKDILLMSRPPTDEAENKMLDYDFEMKFTPPLVVPVVRPDPEWHVSNKECFKTLNPEPSRKITESSKEKSDDSKLPFNGNATPLQAASETSQTDISEDGACKAQKKIKQSLKTEEATKSENIVSPETASLKVASMADVRSRAPRRRYEEGKLIVRRESVLEPRDGPPLKCGGETTMCARKIDVMTHAKKEDMSNKNKETFNSEIAKSTEKAGTSADNQDGRKDTNSGDEIIEMKKIHWSEIMSEQMICENMPENENMVLRRERKRKRSQWSPAEDFSKLKVLLREENVPEYLYPPEGYLISDSD